MNDDKLQTDELLDQTVLELKRALEEENVVWEDNKVTEPDMSIELETLPKQAVSPEPENVDYGEIKSKLDEAYTAPGGGLPMSLSIETEGSLLTRIANIGDALPIKAIKVFSTGTDIPEALAIRLYAGERMLAENNVFVTELTLEGIRKLSYGRPIITVVINVDHDMHINIEVTDEGSLQTVSKSVSRQWIPPQDEIVKMVREANDNAAADAAKALKIRKIQMARESLCKAELDYGKVKKKLNPEKIFKYRKYMKELKLKLKKIKSYDMSDVAEKSLANAVNKLNAIVSPE